MSEAFAFMKPGDAAAPAPKLAMAPMIDCVLLLVCFYLLVGQVITSQKDASVKLPPMSPDQLVAERPAEVTINLRSDGQIIANGRRVAAGELAGMLAAQAGAGGQAVRVVIRADRRQNCGELDAVLAACRSAGLSQVTLRAETTPD